MQTQQFITDDELVIEYINGDESVLEVLINRHKRRIFSNILMMVKDRDLAEDIFQDTFFKVVNSLRKGQYYEDGKFLPWVLRISQNLVIDYFRKKQKMPTISDVQINKDGEEYSLFDRVKMKEQSRETEIVQKQMYDQLKELIDLLPAEQKEVLMMRHYFDMSFNEISDLTGTSLNTSLGRMRYALINLRKLMKEKHLTMVV
jgi:RNA polymerase sigma factor (sigma-70 family)